MTSLDTIDGGDGTDTLNSTDVNAISIPASADVQNVEIVNLTSGGSITSADVSGWTGLQTLNAVATGAADITVADDVVVDVDASDAAGDVVVTGGSTVTAENDTASAIAVAVGAATTSVTTTGGAKVTIGDTAVVAGTFTDDGDDDTLTSASITGNTDVSAVNSDELTTLSLADSDQNSISTKGHPQSLHRITYTT